MSENEEAIRGLIATEMVIVLFALGLTPAVYGIADLNGYHPGFLAAFGLAEVGIHTLLAWIIGIWVVAEGVRRKQECSGL